MRRFLSRGAAMTSMVAATCFLLAATAATASHSSQWLVFRTNGVRVSYPPGWHVTTRALTPVTGPGQLLAVASYPFPADPRPDGCSPAGTLAKMPPTGALIFVWYYGENLDYPDFPPRPAHFKLGSASSTECFGRSFDLRFRQSDRYFQVNIVFGKQARAAARTKVLAILDSFAA